MGEVTLMKSTRQYDDRDLFWEEEVLKNIWRRLKENEEKRLEHFSRYDIRSVKIFTDEDVISKLMTLFI